MNKKSLKIIVLLLVLIIIIILLQLIISLNTVYIGNNTRIISIGTKIITFENNNKIILRNVNIYKNGRVIDGFVKSSKMDNETEYYLVNKKNKRIDMKTPVFSGKMVMVDVISLSDSVSSIDKELLDELNNLLHTSIELDEISEYNKISYDIDNDSSKEDVIYVSYFVDNMDYNKILINDNNVIEIIDYDYNYDNLATTPQKVYNLVGLIDFNKDKKYEIVISRVEGDSQPAYYDIYGYEDGSIKKIK